MSFKKVDPKQDFVELEHEIIDFWKKNKIQEKYLKKNEKSKRLWSFLDGPITANNPMGVHHAWGRTLKDLWQRFYTMKGYRQRYQNGFDCQGLWVEVGVEKELGFNCKKDIEKYGIEKFVNKCKERVDKYARIMTKESIRLAQWMDWDNSYYTMSDENNYTIWHFLKVCFENGWIYKGTDSVPWCPRCGTAISQHEILTEEYKEVVHDAVYFKLLLEKFPISNFQFPNKFQTPKSKSQNATSYKLQATSLLVWTTTPWTIPANVAVAVDPKKEYGIYSDGKENLVLLKQRAEKVLSKQYTLVRTIIGNELIGLEYTGPFDDIKGIEDQLENYKRKIVESDKMILPVSENEGTGMVHIATGAGAEDFKLGQKHKISVVNVIEEDAKYSPWMGYLAGKNAKKSPELIFDLLKSKNKGLHFFKIEPYKHRYPNCWRCKEELVWRNVAEWYIAMDKPWKSEARNPKYETKTGKTFRERMINVAKKIKWIPKWGLDRELDWLNNMHDWLISKKRYWGLALPIWECKCGNFEVIGSREDLKKRAIEGWGEFEGNSPHKPWIDKVKIKCHKCGRIMNRIPDVGNPWLDAGIVPFSTYIDPKTKKVSYTTDKKYWQEWFPADFITECFPGQFKNWFYSLIAMATALEDKKPYKTLLGHALVRDEHGREMHKSAGNAIWFDEAAEKMGVDVMRFMYAKQNPVQNLNFGYNPAREVLRKFVLILWNSYSFFITYANVDGWKPEKFPISQPKTGQLLADNFQFPNKFQIPNSKNQNILDNWIIARLNETIKNIDESLSKYDSYHSIEELEKFVNELSTWYLRLSRKRRDKQFYQTMYFVLLNFVKILGIFMPHLAESIYQNLKTDKDSESVHLCEWPTINLQLSTVNQQLLDQMQRVRDIVEIVHSIRKEVGIKLRQPLAELRIQKQELSKELLNIIAQEVNVKHATVVESIKGGKDWIEKEQNHLKVSLNTNITPELAEEGALRELIRQIQFLRKKSGITADNKIELYWETDSKYVRDLINKHSSQIADATICTKIENLKTDNIKISKDINIHEEKIWLGIE